MSDLASGFLNVWKDSSNNVVSSGGSTTVNVGNYASNGLTMSMTVASPTTDATYTCSISFDGSTDTVDSMAYIDFFCK